MRTRLLLFATIGLLLGWIGFSGLCRAVWAYQDAHRLPRPPAPATVYIQPLPGVY